MDIDMEALKKYLLGWLVLVALAIINGAARTMIYGPYMSELTAHQVSTVTGIALVAAATYLMNRAWPIPNKDTALAIGASWLVMTPLFEFGFGHYVMGHPWSKLLYDYNILEGRIWLIFLVASALTPYAIFKISRNRPKPS